MTESKVVGESICQLGKGKERVTIIETSVPGNNRVEKRCNCPLWRTGLVGGCPKEVAQKTVELSTRS